MLNFNRNTRPADPKSNGLKPAVVNPTLQPANASNRPQTPLPAAAHPQAHAAANPQAQAMGHSQGQAAAQPQAQAAAHTQAQAAAHPQAQASGHPPSTAYPTGAAQPSPAPTPSAPPVQAPALALGPEPEPEPATIAPVAAATTRHERASQSIVQNTPGSKLTVGPNIKLKGVEICDCDVLVVEGHVEATVHSKAMQIAQPGTLRGTVVIDVAEIDGTFTGELTAQTKLVVNGTGRVSGTIRYGSLIVAEGGEISGDIKRIDASEADLESAHMLMPETRSRSGDHTS